MPLHENKVGNDSCGGSHCQCNKFPHLKDVFISGNPWVWLGVVENAYFVDGAPNPVNCSFDAVTVVPFKIISWDVRMRFNPLPCRFFILEFAKSVKLLPKKRLYPPPIRRCVGEILHVWFLTLSPCFIPGKTSVLFLGGFVDRLIV